MKGADHVLSERVIDRGLAADRRIHLCEQRGRDLDEGHAALIGGGRESRQIPDHPAPQGDECGIAPAPLLEQCIKDVMQGAPILVLLAVGHDDADHFDVLAGEHPGDALEIERRHGGVGDDGHFPLCKERSHEIDPIQKPGTDMNGIGALPERYAERLHASSNRASTCASRGPMPWRPVSSTAPPPVASTMSFIAVKCSITSASRFRKPASLSMSKMTATRTPVRASI